MGAIRETLVEQSIIGSDLRKRYLLSDWVSALSNVFYSCVIAVLSNQMTTLPAKVKVRACWRVWGGAYTLNL